MWQRESDPRDRLGKLLTVLGHSNRAFVGPDQLHVELVQHSLLMELHRKSEGGLPSHRRQDGVGPLLLDDACHPLGRERFDIGAVGESRIGHDRRRIRVHQHDTVPFFLQSTDCLGSRVIELARLSDDDRARAQDQDRFEVVTSWHEASPTSVAGRTFSCGRESPPKRRKRRRKDAGKEERTPTDGSPRKAVEEVVRAA